MAGIRNFRRLIQNLHYIRFNDRIGGLELIGISNHVALDIRLHISSDSSALVIDLSLSRSFTFTYFNCGYSQKHSFPSFSGSLLFTRDSRTPEGFCLQGFGFIFPISECSFFVLLPLWSHPVHPRLSSLSSYSAVRRSVYVLEEAFGIMGGEGGGGVYQNNDCTASAHELSWISTGGRGHWQLTSALVSGFGVSCLLSSGSSITGLGRKKREKNGAPACFCVDRLFCCFFVSVLFWFHIFVTAP